MVSEEVPCPNPSRNLPNSFISLGPLNVFPVAEFQNLADKDYSSVSNLVVTDQELPSFDLSDFLDWQDIRMEPLEEPLLDCNLNGDFPKIASYLPAQEHFWDLSSFGPDVNFFNVETPADNTSDEEEKNLMTKESFEETVSESSSTTKRLKSSDRVAGKKYLEMRRKNNLASQRSRKIRKQKDTESVQRLFQLEKDNKELTLICSQLEKERDLLKSLVVQIMSKK